MYILSISSGRFSLLAIADNPQPTLIRSVLSIHIDEPGEEKALKFEERQKSTAP